MGCLHERVREASQTACTPNVGQAPHPGPPTVTAYQLGILRPAPSERSPEVSADPPGPPPLRRAPCVRPRPLRVVGMPLVCRAKRGPAGCVPAYTLPSPRPAAPATSPPPTASGESRAAAAAWTAWGVAGGGPHVAGGTGRETSHAVRRAPSARAGLCTTTLRPHAPPPPARPPQLAYRRPPEPRPSPPPQPLPLPTRRWSALSSPRTQPPRDARHGIGGGSRGSRRPAPLPRRQPPPPPPPPPTNLPSPTCHKPTFHLSRRASSRQCRRTGRRPPPRRQRHGRAGALHLPHAAGAGAAGAPGGRRGCATSRGRAPSPTQAQRPPACPPVVANPPPPRPPRGCRRTRRPPRPPPAVGRR